MKLLFISATIQPISAPSSFHESALTRAPHRKNAPLKSYIQNIIVQNRPFTVLTISLYITYLDYYYYDYY